MTSSFHLGRAFSGYSPLDLTRQVPQDSKKLVNYGGFSDVYRGTLFSRAEDEDLKVERSKQKDGLPVAIKSLRMCFTKEAKFLKVRSDLIN